MSESEIKIKEQICDIGKRIYDRGMVAANDGNISVKLNDHEYLCTPTGVSKGFMTEDMMVCIDLEGKILEGTRKPSSEVKMHLRAYRESSKIKAVVHAHPIAATTFAIARIPLDKAIMTESVIGLGVVPVAPYATAGTQAVPDSVAPFFCDYNAVLLANHGALTWGEDPLQAYYRMESVECCATVMMNLGYLDRPAQLLTRAQMEELVAMRGNFGVTAGGLPLCAEDIAGNKR